MMGDPPKEESSDEGAPPVNDPIDKTAFRNSFSGRDEEASIPDTIAICKSYSSSWGCDTEGVILGLDEVDVAEKMEEYKESKPDLCDDAKKELRAFSMEMLCCLTVLVVIGVGVGILWEMYADPSFS
jgi:hypothetical protein